MIQLMPKKKRWPWSISGQSTVEKPTETVWIEFAAIGRGQVVLEAVDQEQRFDSQQGEQAAFFTLKQSIKLKSVALPGWQFVSWRINGVVISRTPELVVRVVRSMRIEGVFKNIAGD